MPSNLNDGDGTESEDPSTVSWAASGGFPATRPFFSSGFRSRKSGDRGGAEEKRSIFFPVFIFQILSPFSCILPFLGLLDVRLVAAAEGWSTGGAGGRVAAEGFDRSLSCGWALRGRREGMGWETTQGVGEGSCSPSPSAAPATPSCSPNGKRSRDATEDEVYLDNFHSHKRYLSEVLLGSVLNPPSLFPLSFSLFAQLFLASSWPPPRRFYNFFPPVFIYLAMFLCHHSSRDWQAAPPNSC